MANRLAHDRSLAHIVRYAHVFVLHICARFVVMLLNQQCRWFWGRNESIGSQTAVVCNSADEKAKLMKMLKLPKSEQYISPSEIFALAR